MFTVFFNGDGRVANYRDDGLSASTRFVINSRFYASIGYAYLRDRSGGDNDGDQISAACEYYFSKRATLYASTGWLRNRGFGQFALNGTNVTGLTPSWPGSRVRGVQVGMMDRFSAYVFVWCVVSLVFM